MQIGRDLVRLLIEVARVPSPSAEVEGLWHDLLHNPAALKFNAGPNARATGDANGAAAGAPPPPHQALLALMRTRTSRRFVFSVIPYELEQKLAFLFNNVKTRFHRRYFDWIQQKVPSAYDSALTRTCVLFVLRSEYPYFYCMVFYCNFYCMYW